MGLNDVFLKLKAIVILSFQVVNDIIKIQKKIIKLFCPGNFLVRPNFTNFVPE
jgi:hypothetical protein